MFLTSKLPFKYFRQKQNNILGSLINIANYMQQYTAQKLGRPSSNFRLHFISKSYSKLFCSIYFTFTVNHSMYTFSVCELNVLVEAQFLIINMINMIISFNVTFARIVCIIKRLNKRVYSDFQTSLHQKRFTP